MRERVLLVIDSARPGGLATQAAALASRLGPLGLAAEVCPLDAARPGGGPAGCDRRWPADPFALRRLRRGVRRSAPAVVHAWGEAAAAYAALAAGRAGLVVTLGRVGPHPPGWRQWLRTRWRRRADQLVAPSQAIAGRLGGRVAVIPPGVTPPASGGADRRPARGAVFAELNLPPGTRVVMAAARMLPRKGVKELLWCADLMRAIDHDNRLVVFGGGPQLPALRRFARMASDPDHIRLLGERRDVTRLLGAADVFWHAGDEHSPPLAVLEAMSAGVPVVADDTPGARMAIADGLSGRLVPHAARAERARATQGLLSEPELAARLGEAGRGVVVERFSADAMASAYARLYAELIRRRAGAPGAPPAVAAS